MLGSSTLSRVAAVRAGCGRWIETDVNVQSDLVADMAAGQRPAAGTRDVLDIQLAEASGFGFRRQRFDCGDGLWRAPEAAAVKMNRLETGPLRRQTDGASDATPGGGTADDAQRPGDGTGGGRRAREQEEQAKEKTREHAVHGISSFVAGQGKSGE